MRVLIERNQYKERLIELQDAVRRADIARAEAKEQMATKPTKKRSSVWGLWVLLICLVYFMKFGLEKQKCACKII